VLAGFARVTFLCPYLVNLEQQLFQIIFLQQYTVHISLIDAAFFGAVFIILTFSLLLWFTRRTDQSANRFLAIALLVVVLWMARLVAIEIGLTAYIPFWNRIPMQFSLALGPLLFFYVLKITRPEYRFNRWNLLHFVPLLLEIGVLILKIRQLSPFLKVGAFISFTFYLFRCHRLIEDFYKQQKFNGGDRYRYQLRWLRDCLVSLGLLWLLWMPVAAINHFYPGSHLYYFEYLLLVSMTVFCAAKSFSRQAIDLTNIPPAFIKPPVPGQLKEKASWLMNTVKEKKYYEDPELNLASLAKKLEWHTHE
jgi:putative ABC transport system permease protein